MSRLISPMRWQARRRISGKRSVEGDLGQPKFQVCESYSQQGLDNNRLKTAMHLPIKSLSTAKNITE
jgi:hypothetical protein